MIHPLPPVEEPARKIARTIYQGRRALLPRQSRGLDQDPLVLVIFSTAPADRGGGMVLAQL